jgi:hypothetical protein
MPKYLVTYRIYGTLEIEAPTAREARNQVDEAKKEVLAEGLSFDGDDVETTSVQWLETD